MPTQELRGDKDAALVWDTESSVPMTVDLSDYALPDFLRVAAAFGCAEYAYVVTPNVDHLIRYHDQASFRELYSNARFVLLDSRFLAYLLRVTKRLTLAACPGSDLTARLFSDVMAADDRIVLIGGSEQQAQLLSTRYGLRGLRHHNPPMGFIDDPAAVEECLKFIEAAGPFRFCLLAVGSPQQEMLARLLQTRGRARGLALCVGASINFLTGVERRAPRFMQLLGLEWLFRLLSQPSRMARRYLVRGPRIFLLLPRLQFRVRKPA